MSSALQIPGPVEDYVRAELAENRMASVGSQEVVVNCFGGNSQERATWKMASDHGPIIPSWQECKR